MNQWACISGLDYAMYARRTSPRHRVSEHSAGSRTCPAERVLAVDENLSMGSPSHGALQVVVQVSRLSIEASRSQEFGWQDAASAEFGIGEREIRRRFPS